jgi:predicted Zn-dependent protease with MMP-like domain
MGYPTRASLLQPSEHALFEEAKSSVEELLGEEYAAIHDAAYGRTAGTGAARGERVRGSHAVVSEDSLATFEQLVDEALDELPDDIRSVMSNVAVTVEDEPPPGQPLLGLYQGVPLGSRGPYYAGALPDKITIYRGPIERMTGGNPELLRRQVRRTVLHEIAHHFGISDERLVELDRY